MSDAFNARKDNLPKPGVRGPPLKIALSKTENIPAKSIELVANSFGIAGIHYGNIIEASQNAIGHLDSISTIEIEPTKSAIISASSEIGGHSTLSDSLNSLWNTIHIVKEDGSAILLSENQRGIGGGALQMYIEGRLKMEEQLKSSYTYGLEHMLYLDELVQKGQLGIVSTLPQYYLKKLRLDTYTSLKNVLEELLVKYGKNHKVLVVSDADIAYLKKKTSV
jgi:nickel-dependent lactate racemase